MKKLLIIFMSFVATTVCETPSHEKIKYLIEHNKLEDLESLASSIKLTEAKKQDYLTTAEDMVAHQIRLDNLYKTISPIDKISLAKGAFWGILGATCIYKGGKAFIEGFADMNQNHRRTPPTKFFLGAAGIYAGFFQLIASCVYLGTERSKVVSHKKFLKELEARHENAIAIKDLFSKLKATEN